LKLHTDPVTPRRQTHFSIIYTYTVRQGQTPIQSSSDLRSKKQPVSKLTSAYAHIQYGRAKPIQHIS